MNAQKTSAGKRQSFGSVQKLTFLGLFSAIIVLTAFFPLKTFGAEITLCMVPVAVGGALFGPKAGAVLGTVFGCVSFFQTFGYSSFGVAMMSINPFLTFLVCVPTRTLAGFVPALLAKATGKFAEKSKAASQLPYLLCSLTAPICNTVFFMTVLCLCFYHSDYIQGFVSALGAANPLMFVVLFVGINGLLEIIAGFMLAYPITLPLAKVLKRGH